MSSQIRLIIAGGRGATREDVLEAIKDCHTRGVFDPFEASEVVCGEARGADRLGKEWAIENKIPVISFPAEWEEYGKRAGHVRNAQMGNYATHLLAVWDGESKGTKHMIEYAKKKGLTVHVFKYRY